MNKQKKEIIGFAGRLQSGKSELADICVENGYKKLSFALPLKMVLCEILCFADIQTLNNHKNTPVGLSVTESRMKKLSELVGLPFDKAMEICGSKLNTSSTVRDWLQVVGTDYIRHCDNDWHVKQVIKLVEEGEETKYVFDDIRFVNELKALQDIGAECWFVIRNKVNNISHHISEEGLDMTMFNYNIIVNKNGELEKTLKSWNAYLMTREATSAFRHSLIDNINSENGNIDWDVASKYFIYPEFKVLEEIKPCVKSVIDNPRFQIVENEQSDGFDLCVNNNSGMINSNKLKLMDIHSPFFIEEFKKFYKIKEVV